MLIVEDDRYTRDALQRLFISRGWEVAMVTTQAEGLAVLEDYDPDWVVIPWEQLEGTGERFMLQVRSKPRKPRVVLLTETMDSASWAMASCLKPDIRFRKPIIPEDVFLACEPGWSREFPRVG